MAPAKLVKMVTMFRTPVGYAMNAVPDARHANRVLICARVATQTTFSSMRPASRAQPFLVACSVPVLESAWTAHVAITYPQEAATSATVTVWIAPAIQAVSAADPTTTLSNIQANANSAQAAVIPAKLSTMNVGLAQKATDFLVQIASNVPLAALLVILMDAPNANPTTS